MPTNPRLVQAELSEDMFRQKQPCRDCPFLKQGGVRHGIKAVLDYASYFVLEPPVTFPCHETRYQGQDNSTMQPWRAGQTICAGGLIFAEKVKRPNTLLRLAAKVGWYKPEELRGRDTVVDSIKELLELNKGEQL